MKWMLPIAICLLLVWLAIGNPIDRISLALHGEVVRGYVTDAHEEANEGGEGSTVWQNWADYTFSLSDGRSFKATTIPKNGRLNDRFRDIKDPIPVDVEYLPSDPTVSRLK